MEQVPLEFQATNPCFAWPRLQSLQGIYQVPNPIEFVGKVNLFGYLNRQSWIRSLALRFFKWGHGSQKRG